MSTKRNLGPESLQKKSAYDQEYARIYIKRKLLPFNMRVDEDAKIWDWLGEQGNFTQYIKRLIRADMDKAGK